MRYLVQAAGKWVTMRCLVQTAGILLILAAVWLRALRKMTVNHAAFWGMTGILLAAAGTVPGLFRGMEAWDGRQKGLACVLAAAAEAGGMLASVCLSRLSVKKQEQAIRLSGLSQETGAQKFLFVINTMGQAGAETAFLELLKKIKEPEYDIYLYILMGQGELIDRLPPYVRVLNASVSSQSVLTVRGRRRMARTVFCAFWAHGRWSRKLRGILQNLAGMIRDGSFQPSKLFWRMLSDGAEYFETEFDLAVAWLEGGSAYYVADHVKARKKAAFLHIDYDSAGYTREMDGGCWEAYERIFAISQEVKEHFLNCYPEYAGKVRIFPNAVDQEAIRLRAEEPGGFTDAFEGMRLLTVGRLTYQKGYDIAVEAMSRLKRSGWKIRWYALGEGDQRRALEKKIAALGLEEDFLLLGAVENPYPYYKQADLYVHATRFEGKSLAVQEAQTLGCAVIASDCNGNREQITDGEDGLLCALTPETIAAGIETLLKDTEKRERFGRVARAKRIPQGQEQILREWLEDRDDG